MTVKVVYIVFKLSFQVIFVFKVIYIWEIELESHQNCPYLPLETRNFNVVQNEYIKISN